MVMFHRLLEQGENQPDLLVAALLHDVGKLRYRLNPLERAMVVMVMRLNQNEPTAGGACRPRVGWLCLVGGRHSSCQSSMPGGVLRWLARQA